jgi:hypothetical protein
MECLAPDIEEAEEGEDEATYVLRAVYDTVSEAVIWSPQHGAGGTEDEDAALAQIASARHAGCRRYC